jgi:hypothetical protein
MFVLGLGGLENCHFLSEKVFPPGYEMVHPGILDPDAVHHVQEVLGVHGQHVGRGQHPPAQHILVYDIVTISSFFPYVMRYIF